jgi:hypothetical protein
MRQLHPIYPNKKGQREPLGILKLFFVLVCRDSCPLKA